MLVRRRVKSLRVIRAIWAPSAVRRVARHRLLWWSLAVLFAALGLTQLQARFVAVEDARASWGRTTTVVMVAEPILPGEDIASSVMMREVPEAVVPPLAAVSVPEGALAKVALHPGEIVLVPRMTGANERGLPPGSAAMTFEPLGRAPLVETGDLVDIWVVDLANLSSLRIAERLVVLDRSDEDITVAVPEDQVADAAVAALRPVTIVLVG